MSIVIRNLNFIYNPDTPFEKKALKDINLTIEKGDFFGIIGGTGSGKSTLVQHFNALIRPESGKIMINGADPADKKTDLRELRSKVGMVFQYPEYQLFAETVYEDVAFGLRNYYKSKYKKQKIKPDKEQLEKQIEEQVMEAISLVGLDYQQVKSKSPFDLSGGQKRRAAIAGVIVTKPEILILDEPTAGLDPRGKREIIALMHSLKQSCSPTIIMISHDMNEIAANCTKVAVINEGKIICVKTPTELFKDRQIIAGTGLDIPEAVKLQNMFEEKGIDIGQLPFSAEMAAEHILKAISRKENN